MAMEISVQGSVYKTDYADCLQAEREDVRKAENGQNGDKASNRQPPQDTYISSEKSDEKPNGLYRVEQDENGNKKIFFNDPKKAGNNKAPDVKADHPEEAEEKCVGNTNQVDREIRELKQKKQKIEQQLKEASGDAQKTKELESKLAQIERELSQKDNDTYRKQHTNFTDR